MLQITDIETRHRFDLTYLEGWKNEGHDPFIKEQEHRCCPELARFECSPGEYLCKFELKAQRILTKTNNADHAKGIIKKRDLEDENSECRKRVKLNLGPEHLQEIQLTTWAIDPLQLELLEEEFGTIEWLAHYRTFADRHWKQLATEGQEFLSESVNGKTVVVTKKVKGKRMLLVVDCSEGAVVEGKWSEWEGDGAV